MKAGTAAALVVALVVPLFAEEVSTPVLTGELKELGNATKAAISYAGEHGVAILLHVGMDVQNHAEADALLQWVQDDFSARFAAEGLNAGVFPRMNDVPATGLVYHIGSHIYTPAGSDQPLLTLQQAADLVPDVAVQARLALELIRE